MLRDLTTAFPKRLNERLFCIGLTSMLGLLLAAGCVAPSQTAPDAASPPPADPSQARRFSVRSPLLTTLSSAQPPRAQSVTQAQSHGRSQSVTIGGAGQRGRSSVSGGGLILRYAARHGSFLRVRCSARLGVCASRWASRRAT